MPRKKKVKDVVTEETEVTKDTLESLMTELSESVGRMESLLRDIMRGLESPAPKVAPKIHRSRKTVVPRVARNTGNTRKKGFVNSASEGSKVPKDSGGSLRKRPVPMATSDPGVTKDTARTGGLIKSGAGDGAAALAMFDQVP